eukprot:Colp12_sorted_trinity150504_noHs@5711
MAQPVDIKGRLGVQSPATPSNTPVFHGPLSGQRQQELPTFDAAKMKGEIAEQLKQNPEIMGALKTGFDKLLGQSSGYIEELPAEVKRRVGALRKLHTEHGKLELELQREIQELERKYLKLFAPLYGKRTEIVTGQYEPNDDEIEEEEEDEEEENIVIGDKKLNEHFKTKAKISEIKESAGTEKGIPEFWATAMKNCSPIAEMIHECDEPILKHLTDIKLSYLEDNPGFRLEFVFEPNEFFNNTVLSKTYYLNGSDPEGYLFDHAEGTKIEWKPNKDVTVTTVKKKQKAKGKKGATRTIVKTVPNKDTFFNFFTAIKVPTDEDEEDEDEDGEEEESLGMRIGMDYEAGETFKTKLIPHALTWFTGEALEDESEYDDYEEGDEDEEDDEEDEDDESPPPRKPAGARGGPRGRKPAHDDDDDDDDPDFDPATASKAQAPECKQQ